jgi:ABC-2 type transport system ATP-binding protein
MGESPVIECRKAGKVYRALERGAGARGIVASFFRRRVREHVALHDIDLCVGRGEMVGLIGANGAGKTTLVKCLTGIIPITQGGARLLGRDCFGLTRAEKQRLSLVMGQRSQLWWDIPAFDSSGCSKRSIRSTWPLSMRACASTRNGSMSSLACRPSFASCRSGSA